MLVYRTTPPWCHSGGHLHLQGKSLQTLAPSSQPMTKVNLKLTIKAKLLTMALNAPHPLASACVSGSPWSPFHSLHWPYIELLSAPHAGLLWSASSALCLAGSFSCLRPYRFTSNSPNHQANVDHGSLVAVSAAFCLCVSQCSAHGCQLLRLPSCFVQPWWGLLTLVPSHDWTHSKVSKHNHQMKKVVIANGFKPIE